jgi:hypothetical protein
MDRILVVVFDNETNAYQGKKALQFVLPDIYSPGCHIAFIQRKPVP